MVEETKQSRPFLLVMALTVALPAQLHLPANTHTDNPNPECSWIQPNGD